MRWRRAIAYLFGTSSWLLGACVELTGASSDASGVVEENDARAAPTIFAEAGTPSGDAAPLTGEAELLAHPLCDGSQMLRFGTANYGEERPATVPLMYSHGMGFLYVRGDCRYWTSGTPLDAVRTGVLSAAEARDFALDVGAFSDCPQSSFIAPGIELFGACPARSRGGDGFAYWDAIRPWFARLYEEGTPVDGSLRAVAIVSRDPVNASDSRALALRILWPNAWSLDELVGDHDGLGTLVDGPKANDLRALREKYERQGVIVTPTGDRSDPYHFWDGEDPTALYMLWFRDTLPFENAEGRVTFP